MEELVGETASMKDVMNIIPPLGLAYIAAFIEQHNYDVEIIDCSLGIPHNELETELIKKSPDVVGITATTPAFMSAITAAQNVRKNLPNTITVLGGAHITAVPKETMEYTDVFDVGVIGEGEITFHELLIEIEKGDKMNLDNVAGIVYRKNGNVCITQPQNFIKNLDEIPLPARHLLPPLSIYHPTPASTRKVPQGVLITSRGCPMKCTFCDRGVFGNRYRMRSPENVVDEVENLIDVHGAKELKFFDDVFTLSRKRLYAIFDEMKQRGIDIGWSCLTSVKMVNPEMLERMKKAGCWQVLYGLESGDQRMLDLLKKGVTVDQNEKAVKLAQGKGLRVRADYIVGTPGDTLESMEATLRFAIRMNTDTAHFNKFTPYPGTELYRLLVNQGYHWDFAEYHSQLDHSAMMYVPDDVLEEDYRKFLDTSYRRYYLRSGYIWKQLKGIRSIGDIRRLYLGYKAIKGL